jgi:hypothetical protein
MIPTTDSAEIRFERYVEEIAVIVDHADRRKPLEAYLTGLLLPGERKSVKPMAALIEPSHVLARHQSMHHFVANADWDDAVVLRVARNYALDAMERLALRLAGSLMILAFRKRDATRLVLPDSIVESLASSITVRLRSAFPLPMKP